MLGTEVIHQQSTCSLFQIKQAVRDSSPSEKNYDRFYFPDYKWFSSLCVWNVSS